MNPNRKILSCVSKKQYILLFIFTILNIAEYALIYNSGARAIAVLLNHNFYWMSLNVVCLIIGFTIVYKISKTKIFLLARVNDRELSIRLQRTIFLIFCYGTLAHIIPVIFFVKFEFLTILFIYILSLLLLYYGISLLLSFVIYFNNRYFLFVSLLSFLLTFGFHVVFMSVL